MDMIFNWKPKVKSSFFSGNEIFKLVESYENGKLELFNLKTDIGEKNDLSASLPERTKELAVLLKKWRTEVNANMPEVNPDYVKKWEGTAFIKFF